VENEVFQQVENESRFLDGRTGFAGFTGGLGEWTGYEYGLRLLGGSVSSLPYF
jgi:hypothetical protein